MSRNEDYATGNLLDYLYHQKYRKLIGIGLSRETNTSICQQMLCWNLARGPKDYMVCVIIHFELTCMLFWVK